MLTTALCVEGFRSKQDISVTIMLAVMLVSGCIDSGSIDDNDPVKPGDLVTEAESVDLGIADEVEVYLALGAGNIYLNDATDKLMEAVFEYNIDKWKPEVSYVNQSGVWNLSVVQPNTDIRVATGAKNHWDIALGRDIPLDLVVNVGAGDADIIVGGIDLTDLDVNVGVGHLSLDLRRYDGDNLTVSVNRGYGNVYIQVAWDVGVRLVPVIGGGGIKATSFNIVGNEYHNSVYDPDQPHIVIQVNIGDGDLTVSEMPPSRP
jgi:hypothetical protein